MLVKKIIAAMLVALLFTLIAACANTSITQKWVESDIKRTYKRPLIIGISDSQQTRRIFENHMVAELHKRKITATPSYTIISSKQEINRETVANAIKGTDIDSVLVTYLVAVDTDTSLRESPLVPGYSGNVAEMEVSSTIIVNRGRYNEAEIMSLKNDFYDVASESMIWTVQTKSVAPESIDSVVIDVTALIIEQLYNDKLLK